MYDNIRTGGCLYLFVYCTMAHVGTNTCHEFTAIFTTDLTRLSPLMWIVYSTHMTESRKIGDRINKAKRHITISGEEGNEYSIPKSNAPGWLFNLNIGCNWWIFSGGTNRALKVFQTFFSTKKLCKTFSRVDFYIIVVVYIDEF